MRHKDPELMALKDFNHGNKLKIYGDNVLAPMDRKDGSAGRSVLYSTPDPIKTISNAGVSSH